MSGIINSTGAKSGIIGTTVSPAVGSGTDGYVLTATGAGVDPAWEAAAAGGVSGVSSTGSGSSDTVTVAGKLSVTADNMFIGGSHGFNANANNWMYLTNVSGGGYDTTYSLFAAHQMFCITFSASSKAFTIDHPLPEKNETHSLVHSSIEGPKLDLIYRDKVTLVDGTATVNIDTAARMSEGTFVLLCGDVQCFTSNESDWDAIKGSVSGNILTIECENISSNADVSWMVIGERKDYQILNSSITDENGKLIIEPLQTEATNPYKGNNPKPDGWKE